MEDYILLFFIMITLVLIVGYSSCKKAIFDVKEIDDEIRKLDVVFLFIFFTILYLFLIYLFNLLFIGLHLMISSIIKNLNLNPTSNSIILKHVHMYLIKLLYLVLLTFFICLLSCSVF